MNEPSGIITDPTKIAELPFVIFDLAVVFTEAIITLVFDFTEAILKITVGA